MRYSGPFDTVVVGGGLAGLTAGALVARDGGRVALFERSHALGGRGATTIQDGVHLNLGPHAWYLGGPGSRILADLGVAIPGRTPRPTGLFAIRGGRTHTLPAGFISLLTTDLLGVHGKLEVGRVLASIARMKTSRFDGITVDQWLRDNLADPVAREYVGTFIQVASYTNAPGVLSAGAGLKALQTVVRENVRYVDGGWQSIVDGLRARAQSLGVSIVTSSPVSRVVHEGATIKGVELADGGQIEAATVILAVDPAAALRLVPGLGRLAGGRWPTQASRAACLDLVLTRLPKPGTIAAFGIDRPLYYAVHSATARLVPEGLALVHAAKYLDPSAPADAKRDERELEAMMDLLQPGWQEVVATRRFLPSMTVTHAIPTAAGRGLAGRVPVEVVEMPGLFLAGDWVGAEGTLANAAVASAARAARLCRGVGARPGAVA